MSSLRRRWQARAAIAAAGILAAGTAVAAVSASGAIAATSSGPLGSGATREISSSGSASFAAGSPSQGGGIDNFEIAGGGDGPPMTDRSHSSGDAISVGAISLPKTVTTSTPRSPG